ncbi:MarR family transcriptional regulator [Algicella marina]|uniref:MarR family transcriptional regulator n=1 Tax=Algicella marina TaxID=2683284 RepID=A0A6P1SZT0_9RHOB|nr:MarR family transcriptional regulator [Algicella marina]QHQ36184.1 MarR family transcriptional regulator [Algicella marina]
MNERFRAYPADASGAALTLLNEINGIAQLSRSLLESRLPMGLTPPQFDVINILASAAGNLSPINLATQLKVPKTSMTNTLTGLEKKRLISMTPNPQDGRSKHVSITEEGRDTHLQALAALSPDLTAFVQEISIHRLRSVLPDLQQIRVKLGEDRTRL